MTDPAEFPPDGPAEDALYRAARSTGHLSYRYPAIAVAECTCRWRAGSSDL
ncbi:MAG: hypothetical protein QOJ32_2450 [Frankiaceae bacterium]|nr:hypothetical protein [Frankiaceae bacterium]